VPLSTQVLYGSVTGNAEEIARQLAASARDHGVQSELQSLEKYKKVRACVRACVLCYTAAHPA
jgi:sulfite reductase alpha subunit-like flavoprotein